MRIIILSLLCILFVQDLRSQKTEVKNSEDKLSSYFNSVKYRCIGPFRGGRSVGSSGVKGDPLTYYMGTTGGGVWKTDDAGQHWFNVSDGFFKTGSVGAVAVSESDPNVVYVGMGEHAPRGVMTSHGDGVYKSTDAGKTWTHMGLTETMHISRVVIHPKNSDIVYIAAQGALNGPTKERGIYKTTDGGKTWKNLLFVNDLTGCSELSMNLSNPNEIYATMWHHQRLPWKVVSGGEGSGVYKTMDGGETWNKIEEGLPDELGKLAISVCQSNPDKVYALVESDSNEEKGGLFVSKNAGKSWTRISKDHRLIQRAWYYIEVFADPQNENIVYVLSAPALRSIDGGKTWERITGTHGDYHDLWINPDNPKNLCISNDGGAAISFNRGKSWSTQANMPTAQFYRVNVDNLFPYNIYGGQQDNTSVKIASMALQSRGITERNWTSSAGGESAFLAFDPDNPRYVLGGSYLGTIQVLDTEAKASTNIMPAPIQYLGREARDMKYRYNWNAPIIKSVHEPNTFYHGAQKLLRTRDMGKTWAEASPDLSNNEDDKQGNGGGPYTNEAVGAENYGTLSYVAESPHEAGIIYTATDDGVLQITRDNCATWSRITPKGLKECLINAIEVSPHDPATVYIATTRYKFNDHTPAIYKSTNYGTSWTNITSNIPMGSFTRVVREDNVRKDLLYAGTELGMFISWDGGKQWQKFQLNLPVTPILDLIVKHGDLVVATSGRSFWVLDDLGLIRQYDPASKGMQIYEPEEALLSNHYSPMSGNTKNFKGNNPLYGINPANGMVIYYQLPKLADSVDVTLDIKDASGKLIRSFSSKADKNFKTNAGGPPRPTTISKEEGLNRFVWDLKHSTMKGIPGVYIEGNYRGHKVSPGSYTISISQGEQIIESKGVVASNPLYDLGDSDYQDYDKFMSISEAEFVDMHDKINKISAFSKQIKSAIKALPKSESNSLLRKEANVLLDEMKKWDEDMVQRKSKAYDDVENFPNKFTANYLFMINHAESAIPKVNQPTRDRKAELDKQWSPLKATAEAILNSKVPALNKKLWEAGVGALR